MYWFATASYFNPLLAVVETSSSASCGALVTRDGARARVRAHRLARIEPEDAQPPVAGQAELDRDGAAGLGHVEHGGARGGPVVDRREEAGPTVGHLERPALAPGRVEVAVARLRRGHGAGADAAQAHRRAVRDRARRGRPGGVGD